MAGGGLIRRESRDRDTDTQGDRGRDWGDPEGGQLPEAGRGKEGRKVPLEPSERAWLCQHLDFSPGLQDSENKFQELQAAWVVVHPGQCYLSCEFC